MLFHVNACLSSEQCAYVAGQHCGVRCHKLIDSPRKGSKSAINHGIHLHASHSRDDLPSVVDGRAARTGPPFFEFGEDPNDG